MLKTRVITAVVMLIIALAVIFATPTPIFAVLAGTAILGIGGWEAARLAAVPSTWQQALSGALLLLASMALWVGLPASALYYWLLMTAAAWLLASLWLVTPTKSHATWITRLLMAVLLAGAWLSLVLLHDQSPWWIVLVVVVVAAADIGAYFSGRAIGGAKLAPAISPGKTWAGVMGGLISATILGPIALSLLPIEIPLALWQMALLSFILVPISIIGDLFISVLKRQAGVKDSSKLLPGHGGLLDRLDSLGAVLPFFTLALSWL